MIGVADEIKGQVPRGFVVLKAGATAERLADELIEAVRENIGAVACFKLVDVVPALPKTRSGKILRKTMRGIADGRDEPLPSTIEDPAVLDALKPILRPTLCEASSAEGSVQSLLEHVVEAAVGAAQILSRPVPWDEFGG